MKKSWWVLGLTLLLLLTACSGAKGETVTYTIDMTEYAFTPNTLNLKVGQEVVLKLTNSGQLAHEIMIGQVVKMENNHPSGYLKDFFEVGNVKPEILSATEGAGEAHEGEHIHSGFMIVLPKTGDQVTLRFKVTPAMIGEWEMGCFEQDGVHYTSGMKGVVMVSR